MDIIFRLLILIIISSISTRIYALPAVFVTSTKGVSSTLYSVGTSGGTSPFLTAPVASTMINSGISANASGYAANALLSGSVKSATINWGVSPSNLAAAALMFAKTPQGYLAITAGSALYNYYQQSSLTPLASGSFNQITTSNSVCYSNAVSSGSNPATWGSYYHWCNVNPYAGHSTWTQCVNCDPSGSQVNFFGVDTANSNTTSSSPVTDSYVLSKLTSSPPSNIGSVLSQMHNPANDQYYQNGVLVDPVADAPTITAPSSTTDSPKTSVNPDNSVSKSTDTTSCTQTSGTSITCATTTVVVNTPSTGSPVTTTINNATPETPPTTKPETPKTDCELFPTHIGCSEYGTPAVADVIPLTNVPVSVASGSWGSGSCPSPKTLSLLATSSKQWSFQPVCDFMTFLKPVLIAIAWLSAGFIVLGSLQE